MIRTLRLPLLVAGCLLAATTIAQVPPAAAPVAPVVPVVAPPAKPTPVDPPVAVPALTAADVGAWLDGYSRLR